MLRILFDQKGASHIAAILLVVVIAVAGVVGYKVMSTERKASNDNLSQTQSPEKIQSKADIDQASSSLDEYDGDLNPDKLDDDLNSLL